MTPLSKDQADVYAAVVGWLRASGTVFCALDVGDIAPERFAGGRSGILTLGGVAGSGKTTVVAQLAADLQRISANVAYVAFTGRAFSVLAKKMVAAGVHTTDRLRRADDDYGDRYFDTDDNEDAGVAFTGTIHRLLYRPVVDKETEELRGFAQRERLDRDYDLIVVDEASMVSDELLTQLSRFGVPLLAVGDHGQLPPVAASGDMMQDPDLRLEEIHRQAAGNPIIALASALRVGGWLPRENSSAITVRGKRELVKTLEEVYVAEKPLDVAVLCWTNKTRVALNSTARDVLKRKGCPRQGEVVMCLKNITDDGIFNGMRGVLADDAVVGADPRRPWIVDAPVEFPGEGIPAVHLEMCAPQFIRPDTFKSIEELREARVNVTRFGAAGDFFTFGYAMTCHKSQGSGFDTVILYVDREEKPDDSDWRRWVYTAVTRAAKRLFILR